MNIVRNLLANPELAENPLPPMLPGEMITPSKLHALRRTQLVNLAMAFAIPIPSQDAPKVELLHSMTRAEQQGLFRRKPASQYYMLLASIDPDVRLQEHERRALDAALQTAWDQENPPRKEPVPDDGRSLEDLRAECNELAINWNAKNSGQLRRLIAEKKAEAAVAA